MLPVLIPLLTGLSLLLCARFGIRVSRSLSLAGMILLLGVDIQLLRQAGSGVITLYALGNWPPPFGIVLVLDRLAALLLMMTGLLAFFCLWYAACRRDQPGDSGRV